ncbi:MAG: tetratricopeptide repeat protein, partial [Clostridia bacterium]|nr:tetratricopeptide repeat protein [Clostridia bacterium]
KAISDEITKGRNCAVFYDADYDGDRGEKFYFDLSQMNLFVMPITTRLLTKPNRALGEELAIAIAKKIPVLPLMQESGLEELYKEKFGDLQFLDKNSHELGAISYEEKLDKYLSSILLNDETIKRIREEFDAQIFLSYRKKDRIHANRLMRLIHKNDFCRDIAIWYDEFLTPGENFNDNIRKALDKSGLFVLAVTPNLVNEKNYVMTVEYPEAKKAGKTILPAELVKTDSVLLSQKYENIPDCVDSDDENALTEALLATAKKLVNDENDNSPEHNYLIGLAYLNGIDVEVDHARAREMIEFAANADYLEAIDKMIEMHTDGIGTERNYETAIQWHERKITLLQKRYNETPNEDNANSLFWALIECGDIHAISLQPAGAIKRYNDSMAVLGNSMAVLGKHTKDSISTLLLYMNHFSLLSAASKRLGKTYYSLNNYNVAIKYFEKALEIDTRLSTTYSDRNIESYVALLDLAESYKLIGDIYFSNGDFQSATKQYEQCWNIVHRETMIIHIRAKHIALNSLTKLGQIYLQVNDLPKAKGRFSETRKIAEMLYENDKSERNAIFLSQSFLSLGDVFLAENNIESARSFYMSGVMIFEAISERTHFADRCLYCAYNRLCNSFLQVNCCDLENAKIYAEKAHEIIQKVANNENGRFSIQTLEDLCDSRINLSLVYIRTDTKKARNYLNSALTLALGLNKNHKTRHTQERLTKIYLLLSEISDKNANCIKALELANALCESYPEVAKYKALRKFIEDRYNCLT